MVTVVDLDLDMEDFLSSHSQLKKAQEKEKEKESEESSDDEANEDIKKDNEQETNDESMTKEERLPSHMHNSLGRKLKKCL